MIEPQAINPDETIINSITLSIIVLVLAVLTALLVAVLTVLVGLIDRIVGRSIDDCGWHRSAWRLVSSAAVRHLATSLGIDRSLYFFALFW